MKGSKTASRQGFPTKRSGFYDGGYDEDACWEECTGKEGADADYCEGKDGILFKLTNLCKPTSCRNLIPLTIQRFVEIMTMVVKAKAATAVTTRRQGLAF